MKASFLAISISSVLAAPVFASAPQVDVELANQQTLQLIDGQMKSIEASVQYKLNEQYANATPGTTATVDDVTYEKQSNGTWAAVGTASAALVAGLLSSSSSTSSGTDEAIPSLPVYITPNNDLPEYGEGDWGQNAVAVIGDQVIVNGETVGTISKVSNGYVITGNDGQVMSGIQMGGTEYYVISNGGELSLVHIAENGMAQIISGDRVVDAIKSADLGWGKPGTPDNDLPEYGEGDWGQNVVAVIGDQVIVNGETVGTISKVSNGYVITGNDGQVMSGIQMGGTEYYVISNGGELSLVHIAENGMAQIISGDRVVDAIKSADLGWGKPGTPDNDLPEYGEGDWGQNAVAVIGDQVIVNGETVGTISKVSNGYVITGNDGQVMSGIQMGGTEYYVISNGGELSLVHIAENGMAQIISGDRVVDAIKSADLGWGKPGTPDNDLPEYGEGDWGQNAVAVIGDQVIVNGETVGTISKVSNGYVITGNDGQVMSGIQMGGTEYYVISNGGELSLVHIAENGMAQIISGDRVVDAIKSADLGWGKPGTPDNDLPEYGEGDWGQNAVAVIGDQVIVNGETVGTISKVSNGYVITGNDGQVMSGIQMGGTEYYVISNGGELSLVHIAENGMAQIISGDRVVDAIKSADLGWGKPGTPDNDLPEYGEGDWGQNAVAVIGDQVIVNGETVGTISKVSNGYVITGNDGQVMSGIQMGGTEYYVISNGGELSLVHIAENGMAQIISGDRVVDAIKSADLGWGKPGTPDNDLPEYGEGDWGQNAVAVIGDQVIVNGETVGTISKVSNGYVITGNDGQVMSGIQMGGTEYYVISNGGELSLVHIAENGMAQIISGDRVVDAIKSADLGWGKPGTPDNDLPEYGEGDWGQNVVAVIGDQVIVNGETVGTISKVSNGYVITGNDGQVMSGIQMGGTEYYVISNGGELSLVHIAENGMAQIISGDRVVDAIKSADLGWGKPGTPDNDLPEYGEGDWGQNVVAVIGDQVIVNGETVGTISKVSNGYVITGNDGQVMSGIQMGGTEYYVISNGGELSLVHIAENGMAQIISGDRVVDAIKSADLGWGKPGTPDNDLPEYGEGDWGQNAVAVIGDQVIVNGETVGTISKVSNGYVITGNDGQVMSGIQMGGTEYYVISNGGELSLVHIAENGMAQIISGDRVVDAIKSADLGWGKPGQSPNPTVSVALAGEHIEVTVNGKSRTTEYTAERVGDSVNILDREGNIVGIGYINTDNETLEFRNGIVVNDRGDVTLPPAVKNNVKDKVQSIAPAKLQKAKSAIQQRLRG